jgi:hypothetical protein
MLRTYLQRCNAGGMSASRRSTGGVNSRVGTIAFSAARRGLPVGLDYRAVVALNGLTDQRAHVRHSSTASGMRNSAFRLSTAQQLRTEITIPAASTYLLPSRPIAAVAMRGGAGVVGGLLAFVLFQSFQRTDFMQKRRIRKVFRSLPAPLLSFRTGPLFLQRAGKTSFTREITDADPSGPIVITGPAGAGKTLILKAALCNRPHTLYFSLRASPLISGEALSSAIITQAGYLMPPTELLSRAIFNRDMSNTSTVAVEMDRGLRLINEVLEEEKARGWAVEKDLARPGEVPPSLPLVLPPLICIDELNLNEVGSGLLDDPHFWKLVDWAMHIGDNRLGHVIFSCSLDVADMLDAYPGFRMRRTKMHFDFPRPHTVHDYFSRVVNPFLRDRLGATPRHTEVASLDGTPTGEERGEEEIGEPESSTTVSHEHIARMASSVSWYNPLSWFRASNAAASVTIKEEEGINNTSVEAVPASTHVVKAAAASTTTVNSDGNAGIVVTTVAVESSPLQATPVPATPHVHHIPAIPPTLPVKEDLISATSMPVAEARAAAARPPTTTTAAASPPPSSNRPLDATAAAPKRSLLPWEYDARIEQADPDRDHRSYSPDLHTLEPWEIDRIVEIVGGHLKDIDVVVSAITRGKHWSIPLERMVADSCDLVERTFDEMLAGASGPVANNPGSGNKQKSGGFAGLLPRSRAGSRLGLSGYSQPAMPTADFTINPSPERLAAYARYLRGWALLTALSQRKYIPRRDLVSKYFAECPHELDFFNDAGLIMSVNVKTSAKMHVSHGATTGVFGQGGTTSLTLPGMYVSASSPRMRVAFRVLAADPKLRAQSQRVAACLSLARLRQDEEKLLKRTQEISGERAFAAQQLSILLSRDTSLRGNLTKEMLNAGFPSMRPEKEPSSLSPGGAGEKRGGIWALALPLAEELPPMGMHALQATLHTAEVTVRRLDEEMSLVFDTLKDLRAAIVAAQRRAETPLPGSEDITSRYSVADDRMATALGANMSADIRVLEYSDSDASDDEISSFLQSYGLRRRRSAAPSGKPAVEGQAASSDASQKAESEGNSENNNNASPAPAASAWNSLEVYRGNTARAIQMNTSAGGYAYRGGSWEYVAPSSSPLSSTSTSNTPSQVTGPQDTPPDSTISSTDPPASTHSPYGGYRWWL